MRIAGKICGILFETALLLLLVLAIIAPLHAAFTRHLPLVETLDERRAVIEGDVSTLSPGDTLPLYRFTYNQKTTVGMAAVERTEGKTAIIHADPSQLRIGLSAVREAVVFDSAWVSGIETALIIAALLSYTLVYYFKRRSPFLLFGEWARALPIPRAPLWWLINVLVGVPFVWFMGMMPLRVGAYLINLANPGAFVSFDPYLPYVWGIFAALYYVYLLWRRRSPVLAFWRAISYPTTDSMHSPQAELGAGKKVGVIKQVGWKRGFIMWALHLVIVYFFATTLISFLIGDIAAAQLIGYPESMEEFFAASKYIMWALTVVGVLLGYGYSVVSILWGQFIRNLDFTITGWLTNAFCYPLLGVVIWHMAPSFTGPSPIITAGPALYLMLVLGFAFNLLYMLSIWNLGTMFDLMADKGVRTSLFYSVIRHPNYMLEACMFFALEIVGLWGGIEWLAIMMIFFLYWIRSEREDNFMLYSNPEYEPYTHTTPYKFIPGVY